MKHLKVVPHKSIRNNPCCSLEKAVITRLRHKIQYLSGSLKIEQHLTSSEKPSHFVTSKLNRYITKVPSTHWSYVHTIPPELHSLRKDGWGISRNAKGMSPADGLLMLEHPPLYSRIVKTLQVVTTRNPYAGVCRLDSEKSRVLIIGARPWDLGYRRTGSRSVFIVFHRNTPVTLFAII